jgi:hypothetical protein
LPKKQRQNYNCFLFRHCAKAQGGQLSDVDIFARSDNIMDILPRSW